MSLFFTILFQLSASYFYASLIILLFSKRFEAPQLRLYSNRYALTYGIYWLILCITEWPNSFEFGYDARSILEFMVRHLHLILIIPVFLRPIAQSVAYTIVLMVLINPWRESIQNWMVDKVYNLIGESSVVAVQTGPILGFDHWNAALMILICVHLFVVFHFYQRTNTA